MRRIFMRPALPMLTAVSLAAASPGSDALDPDALEAAAERVISFEKGLVQGQGEDLKANRPAIREFYANLETPEEKIEFIGMGVDRYVRAMDSELATELAARLLDDPHLAVRAKAAKALGYLRTAGTAVPPGKIIALFETGEPEAQDAALYAMGFSGDAGREAFGPYLLKCLDHPEARIRAKVPFPLVKLTRKRHFGAIAELLDDPHPEPRAAAVQMLGRAPAEEFAQRAAALLTDESRKVRERAMKALVTMGAKAQAEVIADCLTDEDDLIRATAAWALGDLGMKTYADRIVPLLDDARPRPRRLAVEALGKIGGERHRAAIHARLDDEDRQTRERAREALRVLDDQPAASNAAALQ